MKIDLRALEANGIAVDLEDEILTLEPKQGDPTLGADIFKRLQGAGFSGTEAEELVEGFMLKIQTIQIWKVIKELQE